MKPRSPRVPGDAGRGSRRHPRAAGGRGVGPGGESDGDDEEDLRRGGGGRGLLRGLDGVVPAPGRRLRPPPGQVRTRQRPCLLRGRVAGDPDELRARRGVHALLPPLPRPLEVLLREGGPPRALPGDGCPLDGHGRRAGRPRRASPPSRRWASATRRWPRTSSASATPRSRWCPGAGPSGNPRAAPSWRGAACRRWWPTPSTNGADYAVADVLPPAGQNASRRDQDGGRRLGERGLVRLRLRTVAGRGGARGARRPDLPHPPAGLLLRRASGRQALRPSRDAHLDRLRPEFLRDARPREPRLQGRGRQPWPRLRSRPRGAGGDGRGDPAGASARGRALPRD